MPPKEEYNDKIWFVLDSLWYWCLLVLIGILLMVFFENFWADIAAGVTLIFIGWIIYKLKTFWSYPHRYKFCDVQFIRVVNSSRRINDNRLLIPPSTKRVSAYITASKATEINELKIRFGRSVGHTRKFITVIINRLKRHNFRLPSRHGLYAYRMPQLVTSVAQPEIKEASVYLSDNEVSTKNYCRDDDFIISFNEPIKLPRGEHIGGDPAMRIDINVEIKSEWSGNMQFASRINGLDHFSIVKVSISSKYEV